MKDFKLNDETKIKTGFTIPEGYFDAFPERVMAQLHEDETLVIPISSKKKKWYFAVAATLVIALTIPLVTRFESRSTAMDKATLENYLTNHQAFSNDDMADLLDDADIQKLNIKLDIEDKAIEDALLINTNLEEYLIN